MNSLVVVADTFTENGMTAKIEIKNLTLFCRRTSEFSLILERGEASGVGKVEITRCIASRESGGHRGS